MNINIRIAKQRETGSLSKQVYSAYGRTFHDEFNDQLKGIHSIFIAYKGRKVIGSGFVRWAGPRDEGIRARYPEAPEIYRLLVADDYRSMGIGSAMIEAMEEEAIRRGFRQVSLGVSHTNPRAYQLYLRSGYVLSEITEYDDEYQLQHADGSVETIRDPCRYLVKDFVLPSPKSFKPVARRYRVKSSLRGVRVVRRGYNLFRRILVSLKRC